MSLFIQVDEKVIEGFKKDYEDVLHAFEQRETYSFYAFTEIWKEKFFAHTLSGIKRIIDLRNFTSRLFKALAKFWKNEPTLIRQVGCLYVMYGFYYKQPVIGMVKFRFTLADWSSYRAFKENLLAAGALEPLYVAAKMEADVAFEHVRFTKLYGPNTRFLKERADRSIRVSEGEAIYKQLNKILNGTGDDSLRDLRKICDQYEKAKIDYKDSTNSANFLLFESNIVEELKETLESVSEKLDGSGR